MRGRVVTRAALISMVVAVLGAGWATPALAEGGDKGNSEAEMTLDVGCHSVEATSSKDISNVKVYFTDGTMVEINPGEPTYSETFDKTIERATAKSGTTQIGDSAGDCNGGNGGGGGGSGDDTCCTGGGGGGGGGGDQTTTGGDDGSTTTSGDGTTGGGGDGTGAVVSGTETTAGDDSETTAGTTTDTDAAAGTELCPAGTAHAGELMASLADCDEADVLGGAVIDKSALVCPSGPYEGMPFTKASDCGAGRDVVLANRILERVRGGALAATGASPGAFAGLAVALILAGIVTLARSRAA